MDTNNQEKTENNKENFSDFVLKNSHIPSDKISEAFDLYQKDPTEFEKLYPRPTSENKDKETSKEHTNNTEDKTSADDKEITIDENTETLSTSETNTNDDEEWISKVTEYYNTKYENQVQTNPLTDGVHFEVSAHQNNNQQLTGTAISFHNENHVEIQKTKSGVEPKDQSFQHFKDHIEALQKLGKDEIALGKVQNSEFCTKVVAAALDNGINENNITLNKDNHKLNFSTETLKEIPVETQTKLIEYALQNDIQIEFGENSPLLDFNNKAVQELPDELKYKYLAMLLANDKTKDKIQNAPKIEFFAKDKDGNKIESERQTVNVKDNNGNDMLNPDGSKKTLDVVKYLPNPALKDLTTDELSTLHTFNRQQQITELKSKVIGKNDDGSDITVEDAHNKVKELRGRIKNGENRQEVLKEVKAETHGNNYFQYAQKHTQQKR